MKTALCICEATHSRAEVEASVANLNCRVGDIAMVVNSPVLANQGTIVYIKSAKGMVRCPETESAIFTWNVIVMTSGKKLVYEDKGKCAAKDYGPLADFTLMPITPHKRSPTNTKQLNLEFGS
jgi:hypothetical protein